MKRAVLVAAALAGLSALIVPRVAALFSDSQASSGGVSMACYVEPCGQATPTSTATATPSNTPTPTATPSVPPAVGGIAELPDIAQGPIGNTGSPAEGPDSSVRYYAVLGGGIVVAVFAASAGIRYARRRWLR